MVGEGYMLFNPGRMLTQALPSASQLLQGLWQSVYFAFL